MRRPDLSFASSTKLLRETLDAFLPPEPMSVADWAREHRWVKSPAAIRLVRWAHETAPYLVGPMEALSDDTLSTVAIVGPAGCGKTMAAENWLLASIHQDPAAFLWYGPTDPIVDAYVKDRIEPMLEAHEPLIGPKRHGRDSVSYKRFAGMSAQFVTYTASNLTNKHVARIVADEVDAYDQNLGDPQAVLNYRRRAAGAGSMLCLISHPDRATGLNPSRDWRAGIMAAYADSDRRTWWWPCPQCGEYSSPNPGTAHHMVLDHQTEGTLEEVAASARLICPRCGFPCDEHHRKAMLPLGRWLSAGQEIDADGQVHGARQPHGTAGFWIVGAMNAFLPGGIGELARERVKAQRDAELEGDDRSLRQVMVKGWGIPYQPPRQVGAVAAEQLAERANPALALGQVPAGVRVLFTSVDAQRNRFELLTRGYGEHGESWVVDFRAIPAEPATSAEDWDSLVTLLAGLAYPLADGSGRVMRVRAAGFDSGGEAGVTEQAYAAWLRARRAGRARLAGRVEGRDAWMLLPLKGGSSMAAPRINLAYPDTARKDRRAAARGQVPVLFFNPNLLKDALAGTLARGEAGANHLHFPAALRDVGARDSWFEQLAAERRKPNGAWEPIRSGLRNEAMDLLVMADALARLHGMRRIDWTRPPAWAAAWDDNSMVGAPVVEAHPQAAVAEPPAAAAASVLPPPASPAPRAAVGVVVASRKPAGLGQRLASRLP